MSAVAVQEKGRCLLCGQMSPCLACYYEYTFCKCAPEADVKQKTDATACAVCFERLRLLIEKAYAVQASPRTEPDDDDDEWSDAHSDEWSDAHS